MKLFTVLTLLCTQLTFASPGDSLVRINSTLQSYSPSQPWEKTPPRKRRGLGTLLSNNRILTTAAMAADAIYVELGSADNTQTVPAKVSAIDYDANLALLVPIDDPGFLSELKAAEISSPSKIGNSLDFYQLENNGDSLATSGSIRSMELLSTFSGGRSFLSYLVKASMQTAGNSFTLPAFKDGKLSGVLTSYNSKDQICDVIAVDIISSFLKDAVDNDYQGFPSLGAGFSTTEDPHFRAWLQLSEDQGGIYINRILPKGSADSAGIKKGDVLLSINDSVIDRRGYYKDSEYGTLFWPHLVSGSRHIGEEIKVLILRDGEQVTLNVSLKKSPAPLIPAERYDEAPPFLIKGGLVFQELSQPYLKAFGKDWAKRAPLNLLDVLANPADYEEDRNRVVVLTRVVPTEATIGYDRISNQIIKSVNGKPIADLKGLATALETPSENGIHKIETDAVPFELFLDEKVADVVDQQFLQRGLPILSRF